MKANRKNKKLSFIRIKNLLRTGKRKFYCTQKISNEFDLFNVHNLIEKAEKSLLKEYNLVLPLRSIRYNFDDDDFVNDVKTCIVVLSLK